MSGRSKVAGSNGPGMTRNVASSPEAILAATADPIYEFDRAGRFRYANLAGTQPLGLTPDDVLGKTWHELGIASNLIESFDRLRDEAFATGIAVSGEVSAASSRGQREFEFVLTPVRAADGEIESVVVTVHDLTERRQAERERDSLLDGERAARAAAETTAGELREINEKLLLSRLRAEDLIDRLRELERLRDEWTSIIAHDLRQPITVIRGRAQILGRVLQKPAPKQRSREELAHIQAAADNLNRMIGDLFDVSQIEPRRLQIEPRSIALPALVGEVVERLAAITEGHAVRVTVDGEPPMVDADPERVEQVLGNLLTNAAKYGYTDSPIDVHVSAREGDAVISVTNHGDGIPATERHVAGLGLGLYIAKGLVEAHGGRIWVDSTPGEMTTFHFTLPRSRNGVS